jgi:hypothetical protein
VLVELPPRVVVRRQVVHHDDITRREASLPECLGAVAESSAPRGAEETRKARADLWARREAVLRHASNWFVHSGYRAPLR